MLCRFHFFPHEKVRIIPMDGKKLILREMINIEIPKEYMFEDFQQDYKVYDSKWDWHGYYTGEMDY